MTSKLAISISISSVAVVLSLPSFGLPVVGDRRQTLVLVGIAILPWLGTVFEASNFLWLESEIQGLEGS